MNVHCTGTLHLFLCAIRDWRCLIFLKHLGHENWCSASCVCMWSLSCAEFGNVFSHSEQTWLHFRGKQTWRLKFFLFTNLLLQDAHSYGLMPAWEFRWVSKIFFLKMLCHKCDIYTGFPLACHAYAAYASKKFPLGSEKLPPQSLQRKEVTAFFLSGVDVHGAWMFHQPL